MTVPATDRPGGFMLMESVLALLLFAIVGTALMTALNEVGRMAFEARRESVLARLLDSELRRAMTVPTLEEGETRTPLDELGAEVISIVEPMEEMENQDGRLLQQMFRIEVVATWWEDNEEQEISAETWRYGRLYQP
jgi:type II secretory pathway component PulJ